MFVYIYYRYRNEDRFKLLSRTDDIRSNTSTFELGHLHRRGVGDINAHSEVVHKGYMTHMPCPSQMKGIYNIIIIIIIIVNCYDFEEYICICVGNFKGCPPFEDPILISKFSEHVETMHSNRDEFFEAEYSVSYEMLLISDFVIILLCCVISIPCIILIDIWQALYSTKSEYRQTSTE